MREDVRNDLLEMLTHGPWKIWDIRRMFPECTGSEITAELQCLERDCVAQSRIGKRGMEEWWIVTD